MQCWTVQKLMKGCQVFFLNFNTYLDWLIFTPLGIHWIWNDVWILVSFNNFVLHNVVVITALPPPMNHLDLEWFFPSLYNGATFIKWVKDQTSIMSEPYVARMQQSSGSNSRQAEQSPGTRALQPAPAAYSCPIKDSISSHMPPWENSPPSTVSNCLPRQMPDYSRCSRPLPREATRWACDVALCPSVSSTQWVQPLQGFTPFTKSLKVANFYPNLTTLIIWLRKWRNRQTRHSSCCVVRAHHIHCPFLGFPRGGRRSTSSHLHRCRGNQDSFIVGEWALWLVLSLIERPFRIFEKIIQL